MKHFSFLSSANRWWSLSAAHPSGHCQDPVNQVRARPENLQLHSDVEECWRRVRRVSAKIYLLPTGSLCCGFTNTQLKTFDKISQKKKGLSVGRCDGAAARDKQVEAIIFQSVHLSPSSLLSPWWTVLINPEGEFYMIPWGFLDLYCVRLLNHLQKQQKKPTCTFNASSI